MNSLPLTAFERSVGMQYHFVRSDVVAVAVRCQCGNLIEKRENGHLPPFVATRCGRCRRKGGLSRQEDV